MKRVTAAIAIAVCAAGFSASSFSTAQAQTTSLQFRAPLNYRFPVMPRSHVFNYGRAQHNAGHHRRAAHFLPGLRGPAVIYRNGEIGIPPEDGLTAATPQAVAQPVVYRLGETGGCGLQQVYVPGVKGRTAVNVWRC